MDADRPHVFDKETEIVTHHTPIIKQFDYEGNNKSVSFCRFRFTIRQNM